MVHYVNILSQYVNLLVRYADMLNKLIYLINKLLNQPLYFVVGQLFYLHIIFWIVMSVSDRYMRAIICLITFSSNDKHFHCSHDLVCHKKGISYICDLNQDATIAEICLKREKQLFRTEMCNLRHVLHQLLPPVKNISYNILCFHDHTSIALVGSDLPHTMGNTLWRSYQRAWQQLFTQALYLGSAGVGHRV